MLPINSIHGLEEIDVIGEEIKSFGVETSCTRRKRKSEHFEMSSARAMREVAQRRRMSLRVGGLALDDDESALQIESTAMQLRASALYADTTDIIHKNSQENEDKDTARNNDDMVKYNEAMDRCLHKDLDVEKMSYDIPAAVSLGILRSDEQIAVELNRRVRELSSEVEKAESEKHAQWRALEVKIGDLQTSNAKFQKKFDQQQKNAYSKELEIRDLKDQLKKAKRRIAQLQVRLVAMELKCNQGWSEVGDRNLQLQKTRRIELNRKSELDKERERRISAIRERDAMARSLRPLRQRNMEIEYALQLKEEEVKKVRSGEEKVRHSLDKEKEYADRMERQAQTLAQERTMVLEDSSRKHLQLQELHEEINDLMETLCQEQNLRYDLEVRMYEKESQMDSSERQIMNLERDLDSQREHAAEYRREVEHKDIENKQLKIELAEANKALELEQDANNVSAPIQL